MYAVGFACFSFLLLVGSGCAVWFPAVVICLFCLFVCLGVRGNLLLRLRNDANFPWTIAGSSIAHHAKVKPLASLSRRQKNPVLRYLQCATGVLPVHGHARRMRGMASEQAPRCL